MLILNDDLSVYCTRGDCGEISIKARINGEPSVFGTGDVLRLKVFEKKGCDTVVMQRDYTVEEDADSFVISLNPADTKIGKVISKPVDYWYEVELNPETNPQTIIGYDEDGPKVFKLFPEGKDVDAEDIEAVGKKTLKELVDYALEEAKASGDFKGEKGDKGDKGDPGSDTDIGLDKGSSEGSVQTSQSEALSQYSFALGAQNVSGCKGYYVWKLDAKNLTITLARTKEEAQDTAVEPTPFTIDYAVGDKITLNCNYEYVDCSTITEINGNVIKVDSLPPYYSENNGTNYSQWSDKDTLFVNNTIYCTTKPEIGLADVGIGAHSEGVSNQSIGYGAHAEGSRNIAKGANSHTEGAENSAEYCAHAEGRGNQALGLYSHAEGRKTTASGDTAHAEGYRTTASGSNSHAEGSDSVAEKPDSHAEGNGSVASGYYSHAEGHECNAQETSSHAEGEKTTASGGYSHAEGSNTTASGSASHAEGDQTIASAVASHSEGTHTTASGWAAHAEGHSTIAEGEAAHAEGYETRALGKYTHVEGSETKATGVNAHAEGSYTTASGDYSHAEGMLTHATGAYSHAEGYFTQALNTSAHAEGSETIAQGEISHAEGRKTTASGGYSHAEGYYTQALGNYAHAEGYYSIAIGSESHAEGRSTQAKGDFSHSEGYYTIASKNFQHVEGAFNKDEPTAYHITGCGSSDTERDNCFTAGVSNGAKYMKVGDTMLTEEQLIKLLALLG